jgi:glutathione S-transferase
MLANLANRGPIVVLARSSIIDPIVWRDRNRPGWGVGQVPFLEDNGMTIFESGACLLHLARTSETLMPQDPAGEADTLQWTIAALNSIEMVSVSWALLSWSEGPDNGLAGWLGARLGHVEAPLRGREWIAAGRFTVADIMMADVLRADMPGYPNIRAYIERACARPAFKKVDADRLAHFAAGDRTHPN